MSALALSNLLAKSVKGQPLQRLVVITEEEIKSAVSAGEQEGIIEEEAREMIYSIFNLDNMITREIMIPRIDIMALEIDTPLDNTLDTIVASGHSRFPVYEGTIDNIIGTLTPRTCSSSTNTNARKCPCAPRSYVRLTSSRNPNGWIIS
jgi:CBS domain containing-hemolysin-like protein